MCFGPSGLLYISFLVILTTEFPWLGRAQHSTDAQENKEEDQRLREHFETCHVFCLFVLVSWTVRWLSFPAKEQSHRNKQQQTWGPGERTGKQNHDIGTHFLNLIPSYHWVWGDIWMRAVGEPGADSGGECVTLRGARHSLPLVLEKL